MRLSIRYWLRRWLVPELEPSDSVVVVYPQFVWVEEEEGAGSGSRWERLH